MPKQKPGKLAKLTDFLDRLDAADIYYTLSSVKEGTVTVGISVPGEHWDVDFHDDGDVEVQVFTSAGEPEDFSSVEELFEHHAGD